MTKAKTMGKVKVYFDGAYVGMVVLLHPDSQVSVGSPGNHTVTFEVSGQKNRNATGYDINIDAFKVVP